MSLGYLSQNGMNQVFNQWATADPNLEQYGFGQLYNQNGEPKVDQKYKGMWVNPVDTTFNEYTLDRSYEIIIYDAVFEDDDGDNENRIISDCEEIAMRLVRFLKSKSEIFSSVINLFSKSKLYLLANISAFCSIKSSTLKF